MDEQEKGSKGYRQQLGFERKISGRGKTAAVMTMAGENVG